MYMKIYSSKFGFPVHILSFSYSPTWQAKLGYQKKFFSTNKQVPVFVCYGNCQQFKISLVNMTGNIQKKKVNKPSGSRAFNIV